MQSKLQEEKDTQQKAATVDTENLENQGEDSWYEIPSERVETDLINQQVTKNLNEELKDKYEKIVQDQQKISGTVTKKDFEMISVIGKGSFGKVILVKKKDSGQLYALKVLKKGEIVLRNQVDNTMTERRILENIKHPFIVNMSYAFQSNSKLFFALEYCPGGELFYYLSKIGRFKEDAARFYASNIFLGLDHLHKKGILYRDLKPENVLVGYDGYTRLADFGLSIEKEKQITYSNETCGTAEYLAPEILNKQPHSKASDWWSFGGLIYEMLSGEPPFYNVKKKQLFKNIKYGELNLDFGYFSEEAKDICRKLLDRDSSTRLGSGPSGTQEITDHPWFQKLNWDSIYNKKHDAPYIPQLENEFCTQHFLNEFTKIKITPQDVPSLQDNNNQCWQNFTYEDKNLHEGVNDEKTSL